MYERCPNCESLMNTRESCPECDHSYKVDECYCRFCVNQKMEQEAVKDVQDGNAN